MKGFIEVTVGNEQKILINTIHIVDVWQRMDKCDIYTDDICDGQTECTRTRPIESYEEVKRLIEEATK